MAERDGERDSGEREPAGAAINAGIPDYLFNDADGTTGDMGACGGPAL